MIGLRLATSRINSIRSGILENVKSERDIVFEGQLVNEKVKEIISALMMEMKQEKISNDLNGE